MKIEKDIPELEAIFSPWKSIIGADYDGYRNHVYRMLHFCFALHECDEIEREKLIIAGVFHDIGIWTENTVDYIGPSIPPAMQYLQDHQRAAWREEITLMITEHHKLRTYTDGAYPLVELFRKGDLVDFSLGLFKFDVPKAYFRQVRSTFPNAGFHKGLVKKAGKWFVRHPLNPAPMMKW